MQDQDERTESGWVIERHFHSQLHFWNGQGTDKSSFTTNAGEAIRFAREGDAAMVLSWVFEGEGRCAEHVWSEAVAT